MNFQDKNNYKLIQNIIIPLDPLHVPIYPVSNMMVGVVLVGKAGWGAAPHSCLKQHRYIAMVVRGVCPGVCCPWCVLFLLHTITTTTTTTNGFNVFTLLNWFSYNPFLLPPLNNHIVKYIVGVCPFVSPLWVDFFLLVSGDRLWLMLRLGLG